MIIDSGSKCNIISRETWSFLKSHNIEVQNQIKTLNKKFMAYGSQVPLYVLGSFEAAIKIGSN